MAVTSAELKKNLGKYLHLAMKENILIAKNGKAIANFFSPYEDRGAAAKSLSGILPDGGITLEESRKERLSKI